MCLTRGSLDEYKSRECIGPIDDEDWDRAAAVFKANYDALTERCLHPILLVAELLGRTYPRLMRLNAAKYERAAAELLGPKT
jgi:phosphoenolpyruvate carboxylase